MLCSSSSPDKLEPRAVKVMFIGYPLTQKGYKLFNLETQLVFFGRQVTCHENIFPFDEYFLGNSPTLIQS